MVPRDELTTYLNEFLKTTEYSDASYNGLQFEGANDVEHIAVAVTAGQELFDRAVKEGADYVITHHGHFWTHANPSLTHWRKQRIKTLFDHDLSLYASHLPLDAHPEVGNNAQLLKLLGADIKGDFYQDSSQTISYWGKISKGKHIDDIEQTLNDQLNTTCKTLPHGPAIVQTIAVCTGGGGYKGFSQALELSVDLFITGDTAEIYQDAKDSQTNVIFAGHHASETLGVKALGQHLAEKFQLKASFIDLPTGL